MNRSGTDDRSSGAIATSSERRRKLNAAANLQAGDEVKTHQPQRGK
jgi:hypothetical protein